MTEQQTLFVETLAEAVSALAMQSGGKKALAAAMRPDLADDPEAAARWLMNALDEHHKTVLHGEHVRRALRYGRDTDCDVLAAYLMGDAGYEPPKAAPRKSARVRLLERQAELIQEQARVAHEIEQIGQED